MRAACNRDAQAAARAELEAKRKQQQIEHEEMRAKRKEEIDARNTEAIRQHEEQKAEREEKQRAKREEIDAQRKERADWCIELVDWLRKPDGIPQEIIQARFTGGVRLPPELMQVPYESWLMQDARLEPFIGKTFEAITAQDAEQLSRSSQGCTQHAQGGERLLASPGIFGGVLHPSQHPRVVEGLKKIRAAQQEAAAIRKELSSLTVNDAGVRRYQEMALQSRRIGGFLAGDEREQFDQALADANSKIVAPALTARVQREVAQAKGFDGLQALVLLERELRSGASGASDMPAMQALKSAQSRLAAEIATAERQRIDALGVGLVGLERGVDWYRDYQKRLGLLAAEVVELRALAGFFVERRTALLNASRPDLSSRIAAANSPENLDKLIGRYIPLESDRQSKPGTELLTQVAQRQEAFEKQAVLGSRGNRTEPAPATTDDRECNEL